MSDLVSIIVPVYNAETYMAECMDSILCQTYDNIELILVNDGSADDGARICDEYTSQNDNIVVIHKRNGGVSSARNTGINAACGRWITFCDSDDWLEPDAVKNLVEAADEYGADWVSPRCIGHYYDSNGNWTNDEYDPDDFIMLMNPDNISESFHIFFEARLLYSTGCRLYVTDIIHRYDVCFNTDSIVLEDFDFNLRYMKYIKTAVHIDSVCYDYCVFNKDAYASKRSNIEKLFSSMSNIQNTFFAFLDDCCIDKKTRYYNFIAGYWIMLFKNIDHDDTLTKCRKAKLFHEIYQQAKVIGLSLNYDRGYIDTSYHLLFSTGNVCVYRLCVFAQAIKRRL